MQFVYVKKRLLYFLMSIMLLCAFSQQLHSWGFFGHQHINHLAVFTLPPGMVAFYKKHIDYVTQHAVDPDNRRYVNEAEAARHYIDLDHYGQHPFDSIPQRWKKAVEKYSEDTLKAYGIVPWHVEKMLYRLTEAFKAEDSSRILALSAGLGHYIADAHVPLHTTENYNGQFTNQRGIHAFWESRLPELMADTYDYWVGKAEYVDYPLEKIWKTIKASHMAKDSVLLLEAALNKQFPVDQKYSYEDKGGKLARVYSREYALAYHKMLNGMVERRMREAIYTIGSFWYTAWINAGQPDLAMLNGKAEPNAIADSSEKISESIRIIKGHED